MTVPSLDDLRQEVDRIDDALVDLLLRRMSVVGHIAELKNDRDKGGLALRPAREAVIMRRLVARAKGGFPTGALLRMWRELFAATTRAQSPLTVAVFAPQARPWARDIARDHFGSTTPLISAASAEQALRMLATGDAQIAILPLPLDVEPWWDVLLDPDADAPRVVARLPFAEIGLYPEGASTLVLAKLHREASGDDRSLIAVEASLDLDRARLIATLDEAGFAPSLLAAQRASRHHTRLYLIEVGGFLEPGETVLPPSIATIRPQILRILSLGGYPRPLSRGELGT